LISPSESGRFGSPKSHLVATYSPSSCLLMGAGPAVLPHCLLSLCLAWCSSCLPCLHRQWPHDEGLKELPFRFGTLRLHCLRAPSSVGDHFGLQQRQRGPEAPTGPYRGGETCRPEVCWSLLACRSPEKPLACRVGCLLEWLCGFVSVSFGPSRVAAAHHGTAPRRRTWAGT